MVLELLAEKDMEVSWCKSRCVPSGVICTKGGCHVEYYFLLMIVGAALSISCQRLMHKDNDLSQEIFDL